MDIIYKIYSVYLYDNQLNHDYIILYNRNKSYFRKELTWDIPYKYSQAMNEIYKLKNLKDRKDFYNSEVSEDEQLKLKLESIQLITKSSSNCDNSLLIKNDGFLTIKKTGTTHLPHYNTYDIYWNETKSGINIHEWEVAGIWNIGNSHYSSYRIWEEKDVRESTIRDMKLNQLFV